MSFQVTYHEGEIRNKYLFLLKQYFANYLKINLHIYKQLKEIF
jgi:hypothetical protein